MTSDHHRSCPIGLQTSHWFEPRLQSTVITLDAIVGVSRSVMERIRDQFLDHGLKGLSEISDNLVRFAMGKERCAEERSGRFSVASR